jgi:integrase
MASIKPHGDKWRAQVARKGVRKSAIWPTKREAVAWANRVEAEIDAGAQRGHTLAEACAKYIETASRAKRDAVKWETLRLKAFQEHFGEVALASITSEMIGEWRDKRLETVTGSTVLREVNLYRNLFTLAVDEWRWLDESPFKGVRLPKENPPREPVWPWKLIKRVLRARRVEKTAEMQAAFRIALHTGLRLKEILGCSFDPQRNVIIIPPSKTENRPTIVPTVARARKVLMNMPKFTVGPNEGSTLFSTLHNELLIEGLTFHDTRATALTLLARKMDVLTLARISRHKDLNILMRRYYRETPEQISARL